MGHLFFHSSPFLLEAERSGCLGARRLNEKLPGKKILPTDLQIRAGLLSPFRLITTTDWLYFHRQVCKQSWTVWQLGQDTKTPSSPAARMDLWDPWPHPTDHRPRDRGCAATSAP